MKNARKKIFLAWNSHQRYAAQAIELFRKRGYDTVYWIGTDDEGIRIPGVIFHDKPDSERGLPAEGIDPSVFPSLEAETIRAFYKVESLMLTRMNKFSTSVDEKKRLYHEMLRYWKGVVEEYRPDYIVLSCNPHPPGMFMLYSICQMMHIPVIFAHETSTERRILFNVDYEKSPPLLAARLKENLGKNWSVNDLPEDMQKFYERHQGKRDAAPEYMSRLATTYSLRERARRGVDTIARSFLDGSFFKRVYNLFGRMLKYSVEEEFRQLTVEPDLTIPFVYVPLHLQPEAQSSLEDIFTDQTLMLEILSYALPKGWLLYVKENPFQFLYVEGTGWSPTRYPGYYKKIVALGNTRLVPLSSNTFKLADNAQAVVTVVGTASLEALFRGKPSVTFGYPWYVDFPGLMRVSGPETMREVFARLQRGNRPNQQQQILAFLKSLDEASICGIIDRSTPEEEGYTREETVPRLVDFLANEMDRNIHIS